MARSFIAFVGGIVLGTAVAFTLAGDVLSPWVFPSSSQADVTARRRYFEKTGRDILSARADVPYLADGLLGVIQDVAVATPGGKDPPRLPEMLAIASKYCRHVATEVMGYTEVECRHQPLQTTPDASCQTLCFTVGPGGGAELIVRILATPKCALLLVEGRRYAHLRRRGGELVSGHLILLDGSDKSGLRVAIAARIDGRRFGPFALPRK